MKKRTRRKPVGLHPAIRQAIRRKWDAETVTAEIHAILGDDKDRLMAHASLLFFVAGGCAAHLGWTGDEPDFRIIRGSINALDDLNERASITDIDRASLQAGMLAAARIIKATPELVVHRAAELYAQYDRALDGARKTHGAVEI